MISALIIFFNRQLCLILMEIQPGIIKNSVGAINYVILSGIEPESWVPETHIISVILQDQTMMAPVYGSHLFCCGGWTRTSGLRVMSPTRYQLLHPAIISGANVYQINKVSNIAWSFNDALDHNNA